MAKNEVEKMLKEYVKKEGVETDAILDAYMDTVACMLSQRMNDDMAEIVIRGITGLCGCVERRKELNRIFKVQDKKEQIDAAAKFLDDCMKNIKEMIANDK